MVMDGNGRWAQERGMKRTEGHKRGEAVLLDVVDACLALGVPYLSAYAFSTENWRRSPDEVRFLMGFNRDVLRRQREWLHERGVRVAGESKYPLKKMIGFAVEGITSFSNKPIRFVTGLGMLCAVLGFAMAVYVIASLIAGGTVAGWASIMMSIWLLGGFQLIALGLIGEYVGKIYMETKARPRYIISRRTWEEDEEESR